MSRTSRPTSTRPSRRPAPERELGARMPSIALNGETKEARPGESVETLLRAADLDPASVIVLLNGEVLDKGSLGTALKDGDSVDLLALAGGG